MEIQIRPAQAGDLPAINAIYNHYVLTSTCTYQDEPTTQAERAEWFAAHGPEHPVTVAVEAGGQMVGWGSLSRFHPRSAYRMTVENSIYVRADKQRQGIGRALLADLMERAWSVGHRQIIGLISAEQAGSLALHRNAGFAEVGRLHSVGFKLGQWLDVVYVQWTVPQPAMTAK